MESSAQLIEEFVEENSGEEGFLADAMDDGKISKANAIARLREAKLEDPQSDEVRALSDLISLYDAEAAAKKSVKELGTKLAQATLAQYGILTTNTIQKLIIDDKWQATTEKRIQAEVAGLIHRLITRISELGERYDTTLGEIEADVELLGGRVAHHLAEMGVR